LFDGCQSSLLALVSLSPLTSSLDTLALDRLYPPLQSASPLFVTGSLVLRQADAAIEELFAGSDELSAPLVAPYLRVAFLTLHLAGRVVVAAAAVPLVGRQHGIEVASEASSAGCGRVLRCAAVGCAGLAAVCPVEDCGCGIGVDVGEGESGGGSGDG